MGEEGERPRVEPRAGATRCPFCHEDCPPEADVRVCRECLSRHHAACWAEGQACGSCSGRESLAPEATTAPVVAATAPRAELTAPLVGLGLVALLTVGLSRSLAAFETMFREVGVTLPPLTELMLLGHGVVPMVAVVVAIALFVAGRLHGRSVVARSGIALLALVVLLTVVALFLPLIELTRKL